MRTGLVIVALAGISAGLIGCGNASRPAEPSAGTTEISDVPSDANVQVRRITMMDACDPTTFNAVLGPGTCVRNGGVTFDNFIAQLTRNQKVGSWHNAPPTTIAREGQTLLAINQGGEAHTFTPVAEYGGGIIPILNQLSGNPVVAEECDNLSPGDFVPPGGTDEAVVGAESVQRFMCCIHPWMRTTVQTH